MFSFETGTWDVCYSEIIEPTTQVKTGSVLKVQQKEEVMVSSWE
jgi:hypothetical protein